VQSQGSLAGKRLGRYEVLGELAVGGMAEILLARIVGPSGFERPVVLKRILRAYAGVESFVNMFLDEARIAARIRHPNVVTVHELGHEEGELFLVMEYLEGESVAGFIKRAVARGEDLDPVVAAQVIAEASAGLHAAHELTGDDGALEQLVHRDVSPQNVFVTYDGHVKLLDFGIARVRDKLVRTEAGQTKGKFQYMSPEQCRGEALDRRSDVFALGIVLYEMSTGRQLFARASHMATLQAICDEPVIPPSRLVASYPPRLETICMRALEQTKGDRYATAADLRKDLLAFVRDAAPPGDPAERLATVMHGLFDDRIAEKREMLQRVRAGTDLTHVPIGEPDAAVDVPGIPEATIAEVRASATAVVTGAAAAHRRPGPVDRWPKLAAAIVPGLVVLIVGGVVLFVFGHRGAVPEAGPPAESVVLVPSAPVPSEVAELAPSAVALPPPVAPRHGPSRTTPKLRSSGGAGGSPAHDAGTRFQRF
jgi:serine/threonine-protein kinase